MEKTLLEKEKPFTNFRLPIDYLDTNVVHKLSDVVAADLELVSASASEPMYDILLKPKHQFAKNMIDRWKTSFTSDADFLQQTQTVITNSECSESSESSSASVDCDSIANIWKDIYETPAFH